MSSPESQGRSSRADARFLALLERAFAEHAGKDARIDPVELKRALGLRSDALAARVFALFDRDRSGTIDREEFIGAVRRLFAGSDRDRLLFAFQLHDEDGDGSLDLGELKRMIAVSLAESDISSNARWPADALARLLPPEGGHEPRRKLLVRKSSRSRPKRPSSSRR
ncbi:MAG: EF-hand domain-containing protein [Polyangiaceae bacterium]